MGANPVPVQMKITGHAESRDGGTMALPLFETSMHPPPQYQSRGWSIHRTLACCLRENTYLWLGESGAIKGITPFIQIAHLSTTRWSSEPTCSLQLTIE